MKISCVIKNIRDLTLFFTFEYHNNIGKTEWTIVIRSMGCETYMSRFIFVDETSAVSNTSHYGS